MLLVEQTASLRCAGKKRQERMPDDVRSACWSPPIQSAIFAGSGQVTGQCDRPGFVAFTHVLLLLLGDITPPLNLLDSVYSVLFTSLL